MTAVRVFDPAMCCSSGVCGPSVDPRLARFAADLRWLKGHGVQVERFSLSREPAAFVADPAAKSALETLGDEALPLVKVDDEVKSRGRYPSREELAAWAGVALDAGAEGAPPLRGAGCCGPSGPDVGAQQKPGCC